jgi:hypothetical protein
MQVYKKFVSGPLYGALTARERDDLEKMFVTKVAGQAVSVDPELRQIQEAANARL